MARVLQVVTELVVGGASLTMLDFAEDLASEHELLIAHGRARRSGQRRGAARACALSDLRAAAARTAARRRATTLAATRAFAALCRRLRPRRDPHAQLKGRLRRAAWRSARDPVRFHTIHGWGHTPTRSAADTAAAGQCRAPCGAADHQADRRVSGGPGRGARAAYRATSPVRGDWRAGRHARAQSRLRCCPRRCSRSAEAPAGRRCDRLGRTLQRRRRTRARSQTCSRECWSSATTPTPCLSGTAPTARLVESLLRARGRRATGAVHRRA